MKYNLIFYSILTTNSVGCAEGLNKKTMQQKNYIDK